MAFRTWGKVLLAALGIAVVTGAGQLGIAYGLGIVRFNRTFDAATANHWPAQRVWVGWFAMVAAVAGAVIADRLTRRYNLPVTLGTRAATAAAAALGALIVAPLSMQPARAAQVASADPVVSVGVTAALGAGIGLAAALATLLQRPIRWNVGAVTGVVWILAVVSVLPSLGPSDPLPAVRLGGLDPSWLGAGAAQRLAVVTMPALALVAGALTGALARSRGLPLPVVASCGAAGPVMLALAYLIAGPGDSTDAYQAAPYWGALIAVATGGVGSVLAAVARWPLTTARTPATDEPTSPAEATVPNTTPTSAADATVPSATTSTTPTDGPATADESTSSLDTGPRTAAAFTAPTFTPPGTPVVPWSSRPGPSGPDTAAPGAGTPRTDDPRTDDATTDDATEASRGYLLDRHTAAPPGSTGGPSGFSASPAGPSPSPASPTPNPASSSLSPTGSSPSPAADSTSAGFPVGWSGVRRLRTEDFWPTAVPTEATPPPEAPPPVTPGPAAAPPVTPTPAAARPLTPRPAAPPRVARPAATPSPMTTPPTAPAPVAPPATAPRPVTADPVIHEPSDRTSTATPAATTWPPSADESRPAPPIRTDDRWNAFAPITWTPEADRNTPLTSSVHQSTDDTTPVGTDRNRTTRADAQNAGGTQAGPSRARPSQVEPSQVEPDRANLSQTEPSRANLNEAPDRANLSQGGPDRANLSQTPDRADPSQGGPGRTGANQAGRRRADPSQTEPDEVDSRQTDGSGTGPVAAEEGQPGISPDPAATSTGAGDSGTPTVRVRRGLFRRNRSGPTSPSAPEQAGDTDDASPTESKQREPKQREPKGRESKGRESKGRNRADEPVPARDEEYVEWVSGLSDPDPAADDLSQESGRRSLRSTGRHHAD